MTILQKLQNKLKNKKNEIRYTPFKTIHTPIVMLVIDSDSIDSTVYWTGCPYLATGIRIGDVSQTEAIVCTRLTLNKKRIIGAPQPIALFTDPETGKKTPERREEIKMEWFIFHKDMISTPNRVQRK